MSNKNSFCQDQDGATVVEYMVLAISVTFMILGALLLLGLVFMNFWIAFGL